MGSLKGKAISKTYQRILQTSSEISDTSLKGVETGDGNSTSMKLSTDKVEFLKVGVGTGGVVPDGLFHVYTASAGSVTASAFANQVVLENSGDSGLSILSGSSASGNIYFGDSSDNDVGRISYDHSNDAISFSTSGTESMVLDGLGNLKVSGTVSQSESIYTLIEYFYDLPVKDIGNVEITQSTSGTTAVTQHSKFVRITTASIDLAASDSIEFTLNNNVIQDNSHVLAYLVNSSGTIADNAMVSVMVHDVDDTSCKIRLSTNAVDVAAQTYEIHVTVDPHVAANSSWQIGGTNASEGQIQFDYAPPGIRLTTTSSDNDQIILLPKTGSEGIWKGGPHSAPGFSPWSSSHRFPSQYQGVLQSPLTTDSSIANMAFWFGYKLTTTGAYATDADQAYFLYATDDDLGSLTTNGNLHFVYSISGVDYITDLGIAVTADTVYRLKIAFDSTRRISVFVNNTQYGLTSTPTTTTAGGVTQTNSRAKSLIMSSSAELVPVMAVQTLDATGATCNFSFIKASRIIV
jgi:hypothetical protein